MGENLIIRSPAKVNLVLRVLRRRDDGYHDIFTVMQPISLYDEVSIEVSAGVGISVDCGHPGVPSDRTNLAYRAAELILKELRLERRVEITIKKNIPVAAGLGGGSSNAASVLTGLDRLLKAGIGEERLKELGSLIGSDVPFFILNGAARAEGRGEILKRLKLPPYDYLLINPGFKVSTAWAYNNLDLTKRHEDNILSYSDGFFGDLGMLKDHLVNDLEEVTSRKFPEIARLKKALLDRGAFGALMSGSGPTVFGVFGSGPEAREAFERLRRELGKDYSLFQAKGLT